VSGAGGGLCFASFLFGTPNNGSLQEPAFTAGQQIYRAGYVEDAFQLTYRLTLTLGQRYEQTGPWTERYDRIKRIFSNAGSPSPPPPACRCSARLGW
jgi:hypothetical protein